MTSAFPNNQYISKSYTNLIYCVFRLTINQFNRPDFLQLFLEFVHSLLTVLLQYSRDIEENNRKGTDNLHTLNNISEHHEVSEKAPDYAKLHDESYKTAVTSG